MKKTSLLLIVVVLIGFSSCSKHLYVNYQSESSNTGQIVLKPSTPTSRTFVTVNDNLIVDKKSVKSVTIANVPAGDYKVHYTSENSWYKDKLDTELDVEMANGKEITKLIEVPPYSTGYWIYVSGMAIIPWVVLFAL